MSGYILNGEQLGRAEDWTYDGYGSHPCEATKSDGSPCRRRARVRYEWRNRSHYLCTAHGLGAEPAEYAAVTR